jgi:hypothetical protein
VTRFGRLVRNLIERWLKRYYEGPLPPRRLDQMVVVFANMHPKATRAEWVLFAARHADEAYRTGWVRGFEWCERDLLRRDPQIDPEAAMLMHGMDPEWINNPVDLRDPAAVVQSEQPDESLLEQRDYNLRIEADNARRAMGKERS